MGTPAEDRMAEERMAEAGAEGSGPEGAGRGGAGGGALTHHPGLDRPFGPQAPGQ